MEGQEEARKLLQELLHKPVMFTKRGNEAIKIVLKHLKQQGYNTLLLPDQAGWMTYPQFGKQYNYSINYLKTDRGVVLPETITGDDNTILLMSTLPAYAFNVNTKAIAQRCKEQGILFINDVAASIGSKDATYGDIILGSFGKAKPLPLTQGGFIATTEIINTEEPTLDYKTLLSLLQTLPERTPTIKALAQQFKQQFQKEDVIHKEHKGYNVIIAYTTEEEKEKLINKARTIDTTIEYTECPRYIRVNEQALSFEIKRKFTKED